MKVSSLLTAIALTLAVAAPATAQQPPAPLAGETLEGVAEAEYDCDPTGPGSATFDAAGVAEGPYPGTFEESGRFDFVPREQIGGGGFYVPRTTDFRARFEIDSVAGDVVGTKSKSYPPGAGLFGACPGQMLSEADYDAIIRTADGTYRDRGTSFVFMNTPPEPTSFFLENFTASTSFAPFTKQDCKDEANAQLVALAFPGGEKECKDFVKGKR